ncbi:glycosyltransferase [Priestia aryabhattai]|uniref:glycosyltransferase n=1 Tax=Priestia aryabhattai TaxID=412384 RepID=UPI001593E622
MKILLATFWSVPHVGGVWNYMQQLKSKLEALGHEVDLLGHGENNYSVQLISQNRGIEKAKIQSLIDSKLKKEKHPFSGKNEVVNYYETQMAGYELGVSYLGIEGYDLIHAQDILSTVCIDKLRAKKNTLVTTIHGSVAHELKHAVTNILKMPTAPLACTYFDELEHKGATSAEITIVANNWLKNILINEFQVHTEQLEVFQYGYDIENFLSRINEQSSIKPPTNQKLIIYTGRLTEIKGIQYLISALSKLKEIRQDWICWIVGDGDMQAELKMQTKNLGLEKWILFLGNRNDVPYLLSISDICVLPSIIDNQPLAVIEAQLAAKPVIVSDAGGLPEMVEHGITGVISPAADSKTLCLNINYLLTHELYRKNLGSNAQKWAFSHWSPDKAAQKIINTYKKAVLKRNNTSN